MLQPQFEQLHYITARFQTAKLPIGEMELSFLGPCDYSKAQDILRLIDPTAVMLEMSWLTLQEYNNREQKRPTEPPVEQPVERPAIQAGDQVYEVIQTTHTFQNSKYLHINVDGKRVGVPPQFNALPGDLIIFRRMDACSPQSPGKESSELKETANG